MLAETQSVLDAAQRELENAKQAAEKASAQRTEIQNKLDEAASETKSVQSRLAETQSRLEAAESELESAKQRDEQAKAQVAELEQEGPISNWNSKRGTASVLSSRRNWMRPDRRLSG